MASKEAVLASSPHNQKSLVIELGLLKIEQTDSGDETIITDYLVNLENSGAELSGYPALSVVVNR